MVYADKERDNALNLRVRLAHTCVRLCRSPLVWGDPSSGGGSEEGLSEATGVAQAAAAQAGEPLFSRLVHVLAAMLAGEL